MSVSLPGPQPPFNFDFVFNQNATQKAVFSSACMPLVTAVLEGYNATLFAYGQTGSGKTFTMMGDLSNAVGTVGPSSGLVPRAAQALFDFAQINRHEIQLVVRVSFFEIYREKVFDLLAESKTRQQLRVRESKQAGVYVEHLQENIVTSPDEVCKLCWSASILRVNAGLGTHTPRQQCAVDGSHQHERPQLSLALRAASAGSTNTSLTLKIQMNHSSNHSNMCHIKTIRYPADRAPRRGPGSDHVRQTVSG
jgi:hypothetical protein